MGRYINTALGQRWTDEPPPEAHLVHARLKNLEAKIDTALEMAKEVGESPLPTPTTEDAFYLAEELASRGTEGLPHGSHIETASVDTTTPLQRPYGRIYTTVATTVTIFPLPPMTPAAALLCGLLTRSGKLSPTVYERMVKETPGIISGRLMGPREVLLDKQRAAQKAYPGLWHA
jgi:hypothetical protein